jgi:hypothetical protein
MAVAPKDGDFWRRHWGGGAVEQDTQQGLSPAACPAGTLSLSIRHSTSLPGMSSCSHCCSGSLLRQARQRR